MEIGRLFPLNTQERNQRYQEVPINEFKLKQQAYSIELRRGRRNEKLKQKRAKLTQSPPTQSVLNSLTLSPTILESLPEITESSSEECIIRVFYNKLEENNDNNAVLLILHYLKDYLSHSPQIVDTLNFLKTLIGYCNCEYPTEIIDKAAWCLANIAAGPDDYAHSLFDAGGAGVLMSLLSTTHRGAWESALWALANSIVESHINREYLIVSKFIPLLKHTYEQLNDSELSLKQVIVWVVACLGKSAQDIPHSQIAQLLDIIAAAVKVSDDSLRTEAWSVISQLSVDENHAEMVIAANLVEEMVNGLQSESVSLKQAMLSALGSLSASTDSHTGYVLQYKILEILPQLIEGSSAKMRISICWILANVAGSSYSHAYWLTNSQSFPLALQLLLDRDSGVKDEAVHILFNLACAQWRHSVFVAELSKFFPEIAGLLDASMSTEYLMKVLEVCHRVILAGYDAYSDHSDIVMEFERSGCHEMLMKLEKHSHAAVTDKVAKIHSDISNSPN